MLLSLGMYAWLGEWIKKEPQVLDTMILKGLAIVSLMTGVIVLFLRMKLLSATKEKLRLQSDDTAAVQRWNFLYILSFALCESIGLYGFVLRFLGASLRQAAGFYVGAIILLLLSTPRRP